MTTTITPIDPENATGTPAELPGDAGFHAGELTVQRVTQRPWARATHSSSEAPTRSSSER